MVTEEYMRGEGAELVERQYQGMENPGVFEYEVMEALGVWVADHSTCTDTEFRRELARKFAMFMQVCSRQGGTTSAEVSCR